MGNLLDEVYRSEELICKGLHEINSKGDLNPQSLEQMGELLDAAKDLYAITMKAEEYDGQSYGQSYGYNQNNYQSYANRRGSSRGYSRGYNRGYSRDSVDDEMISMLEEKMRNAGSEQEREKYRMKIMELER